MRTTLSAASIHGLIMVRRSSLDTAAAPKPLTAAQEREAVESAVCLSCTKRKCRGSRECMKKRKAAET
jgi:hypothetical protein